LVDWTDAGSKDSSEEEVFHYQPDALGSTAILTDSNGAVVESYEYDPYGKTYIYSYSAGQYRVNSSFGNPFMWTGQRFDAATGLYHFWARSYSPTLGRWMQRDP